MATQNHYDVIIIGTGAGGGTLAYHLAPSGKRILILSAATTFPARRRTGIPRRECGRPLQRQRILARQRW